MDRDKVKKVLSKYYMEYISLDEACDMILRLGEELIEADRITKRRDEFHDERPIGGFGDY